MTISTFTRQELLDMQSEAKREFQAAKRMSDPKAMAAAISDMNAIGMELTSLDGLTIKRHELCG